MIVTQLRHASPADAPAISACVCAAYLHYIERIGRQPGPMLENYADVIRRAQVHVATQGGRVVGTIVLRRMDDGFCIENVAVHPDAQRHGVGRLLLALAEREAARQGYRLVLVAAHELMAEPRAVFAHLGFEEFDRRMVDGFARVFFRKALK